MRLKLPARRRRWRSRCRSGHSDDDGQRPAGHHGQQQQQQEAVDQVGRVVGPAPAAAQGPAQGAHGDQAEQDDGGA